MGIHELYYHISLFFSTKIFINFSKKADKYIIMCYNMSEYKKRGAVMLDTTVFLNISPAIEVVLWVLLALVASGIIFSAFFLPYVGKRVYFGTLVREGDDTWGYECSDPTNPEQLAMWEEGCRWADENASRMREVDITSFDGLRLHGEFYSFGSDECVIFLPGRCECLRYSCYFAKPYADMGINVLVIDTRCHGKSEGKYSTIGKNESRDVMDWAKYIHENFGINKVWIHGICVGSAGGFVCLSDENCPDYFAGMVTEGPYTTFKETFKQHLIDGKHPVFPVLQLVMGRIKRHAGVDWREVAPIELAKRVDKHILYLFGERDIFSLPEKSRELFRVTKSKTKKIVWFEKGSHSHLRINDPEKYDAAIKDYIRSVSRENIGVR